jgi:diguanylate cyclase (GGDEF)-like protein
MPSSLFRYSKNICYNQVNPVTELVLKRGKQNTAGLINRFLLSGLSSYGWSRNTMMTVKITIADFLNRQPGYFHVIYGTMLAVLLGVLDYVTGPDLSFLIFYLFPVSLVAWFGGRRAGVLMVLISAVIWFFADMMTRVPQGHFLIPLWSVIEKLGVFLIVAYIVSAIRTAFDREKASTRTDFLTGILNRRSFFESADVENNRAHRYQRPFTMVYMDLDNFKLVNDLFGHDVGDMLLRSVAETIKENIRKIDLIARMGGDEFVILLPETGYEPAQAAVRKIQERLLDVARKHGWPVTFSIGAVTFVGSPTTVDEMIKVADNLMYSVKKSGKNMVRHETFYPNQ